jgi:hypothetical protein
MASLPNAIEAFQKGLFGTQRGASDAFGWLAPCVAAVPQQPVINFCFAYNYSQSLGKEVPINARVGEQR